jgi:hypothetical protein
MFDKKDFLTEIEIALHERTEEDLLSFMSCKIDGVLGKMSDLKNAIQSETGKVNLDLNEDAGRMYYVFSIFINLWNCRN